jgi:hypothetical protein
MEIGAADRRVEGGVIGCEFRIAAPGRMFEEKLERGAGKGRQKLAEIARAGEKSKKFKVGWYAKYAGITRIIWTRTIVDTNGMPPPLG